MQNFMNKRQVSLPKQEELVRLPLQQIWRVSGVVLDWDIKRSAEDEIKIIGG